MKPIMLLAVALLALTGCSAAPAPKATPAESFTATAKAAAPQALSETDYFSLVHENVPGLATASDETLTTIGTNTCTIMRGGGDHPWVLAVKAMVDGGLDGSDAGAAIAFAVSTYCPEMKDKLAQ